MPVATSLPNLPLGPKVSSHVLDASWDAADGSRAIEAVSPAASGEPQGLEKFPRPRVPRIFSFSPQTMVPREEIKAQTQLEPLLFAFNQLSEGAEAP